MPKPFHIVICALQIYVICVTSLGFGYCLVLSRLTTFSVLYFFLASASVLSDYLADICVAVACRPRLQDASNYFSGRPASTRPGVPAHPGARRCRRRLASRAVVAAAPAVAVRTTGHTQSPETHGPPGLLRALHFSNHISCHLFL